MHRFVVTLAMLLLTVAPAWAQQQPAPIPIGGGNQGNVPGGQGNQGGLFGQGLGGGAASADFDSLIDLITSTVDAESWMENGTGDGEIQPFFNGVYADAEGTLRFAKPKRTSTSLASLPKFAEGVPVGDVRQASDLRYVSLPKLEAAIHAYQLRHEALPEEVLTLAGLQRVEFVFVQPPQDGASGDLVIAGPAGDWQVQPDGKIVAVDTGQPVVRLDDLLTLWRRHQRHDGKAFGVSINPRQENLARLQNYIAATNSRPLEPGERGKWIDGLRESVGTQDVQFFGLEPSSHAARVLLVADYHMKLIGMGLADGVEGVVSYLRTVRVGPDGTVPPMTVLRWWFAMNYEPIDTTAQRDAFAIRGPGAKVLSENQLLAARGRRVPTGQSDELNRRYAESFSENFAAICQRYPVYTELRNIFDLTMVLALMQREGLLERAGWQPSLFASHDWLPLPRMPMPSEVESVVNHRVIRRKHIVAGVSGGVWIDAAKTLSVTTGASNRANLKVAAPASAERTSQWWWD